MGLNVVVPKVAPTNVAAMQGGSRCRKIFATDVMAAMLVPNHLHASLKCLNL